MESEWTLDRFEVEAVKYQALSEALTKCADDEHPYCIFIGVHLTSQNARTKTGYITSANANFVGASVRSNDL